VFFRRNYRSNRLTNPSPALVEEEKRMAYSRDKRRKALKKAAGLKRNAMSWCITKGKKGLRVVLS
jgi:hypothetical protein